MEPASKIIEAFGGTGVVSKLTGIHRSQVWKWTKPKGQGGSDGLIPMRHAVLLMRLAPEHGVVITADDFFPEDAEDKKEAAVQ